MFQLLICLAGNFFLSRTNFILELQQLDHTLAEFEGSESATVQFNIFRSRHISDNAVILANVRMSIKLSSFRVWIFCAHDAEKL